MKPIDFGDGGKSGRSGEDQRRTGAARARNAAFPAPAFSTLRAWATNDESGIETHNLGMMKLINSIYYLD